MTYNKVRVVPAIRDTIRGFGVEGGTQVMIGGQTKWRTLYYNNYPHFYTDLSVATSVANELVIQFRKEADKENAIRDYLKQDLGIVFSVEEEDCIVNKRIGMVNPNHIIPLREEASMVPWGYTKVTY